MILVTGDVVLDHNVYEGGRLEPNAPPGNGSYYEPIPGGAMLIYGLLNALDPACVRFGITETTPEQLEPWPSQFHAKALWHAVNNLDKKTEQHWALEKYLGYGVPEAGEYPGKPAPGLNEIMPRILVLDDGGLGFREAESCWPDVLKDERPDKLEWVILKMSQPLAQGTLWTNLMRESWRKRLIVIVSADQLRKEGLLVPEGSPGRPPWTTSWKSWSRTTPCGLLSYAAILSSPCGVTPLSGWISRAAIKTPIASSSSTERAVKGVAGNEQGLPGIRVSIDYHCFRGLETSEGNQGKRRESRRREEAPRG